MRPVIHSVCVAVQKSLRDNLGCCTPKYELPQGIRAEQQCDDALLLRVRLPWCLLLAIVLLDTFVLLQVCVGAHSCMESSAKG